MALTLAWFLLGCGSGRKGFVGLAKLLGDAKGRYAHREIYEGVKALVALVLDVVGDLHSDEGGLVVGLRLYLITGD